MLRRAFKVAFIVGMIVGSRDQAARAVGPQKVALLQPMLEVLDKAELSGSLEISGRCDLLDFPDLPRFRPPATNGGPILQTLREILADDPAMQVMQDRDGTVRMNEIGVPTDILNIRIGHISFEDYAHNDIYAPNDALRAILRAPEVVAFMKAHDIEWPFTAGVVPGKTGVAAFPPDWPHISGSLDNVTLSEALDRVLKTFPGIWTYENCPRSDKKSRVIYFRFYYLRRIDSLPRFVEG